MDVALFNQKTGHLCPRKCGSNIGINKPKSEIVNHSVEKWLVKKDVVSSRSDNSESELDDSFIDDDV